MRTSREHLTWFLLAAAVLVMAIADTGFGYTALVEIDTLSSVATWDVMYNISYIMLGTAMINGIMVESTTVGGNQPLELKTGSKSTALLS